MGSEQVPGMREILASTGKGRIRASTANGGIQVSIGKVGSGRVPGR